MGEKAKLHNGVRKDVWYLAGPKSSLRIRGRQHGHE